MQFEILNTIQFLVGLLISAVIWHKGTKHFKLYWSWKYFFTATGTVLLFTHQQFYTLTEKADVISSQNMMLRQSSNIKHSKEVSEYLENNEVIVVDSKTETEALLKEQQEKSKKLAEQIELKHKEK